MKPSRLACYLCAVAAGLFFGPRFVRAQAPTIINAVPYTINTPGEYQLGKDFTYLGTGVYGESIITIRAGNVTLDFNGHYISGPSSGSANNMYGIYAYEQGNLTIKNGTIAFCKIGILLQGSGNAGTTNINQRVENMLLTYCYNTGVLLDRASNSEVADCRVSFTGNGTSEGNPTALLANAGTGNKAANNVVNDVEITVQNDGKSHTATGISGFSIVTGNTVGSVYSASGPSYGVSTADFAVGNSVSYCQTCFYNPGKYMDNLADNYTTFAQGGTPVGNTY